MLLSIKQYIDKFVASIGKGASWLTAALIIVVCGDVIYRRILNDSQAWVGELEWHLFALLFLLSAAFTLQKDKHVRVDLFYANFSERDKAWVNFIGNLVFLVPWSILILYFSSRFALQSFWNGEGSPQPNGLPYRWIVKSGIPFCFLLLLLQAISEMIGAYLILKSPKKDLN